MNLTLPSLYNPYNEYYGLKDYSVGYFYNISEQKYLNCNHVTNKSGMRTVLTSVPSNPWKLNDLGNMKYILECSNGQVLDIAGGGTTIITYPKHNGWNQQFKLEILESKVLDKVVINFDAKSVCFTGSWGRVFLGDCVEKNNNNFGQAWFWIPEELVRERVFNVMFKFLNEDN